MNYKTDTTKGLYKLINPEKYISSNRPEYKSKWEWRVFDKLDRTPNIIQWGYECVDIYYPHPVTKRQTKYLPDIYCTLIDANGVQQHWLIEIKPQKMSVMPTPPPLPKTKTAQSGVRYKKAMERYAKDVIDYKVNEAKWVHAAHWCQKHKVNWFVMTEENTSALLGNI